MTEQRVYSTRERLGIILAIVGGVVILLVFPAILVDSWSGLITAPLYGLGLLLVGFLLMVDWDSKGTITWRMGRRRRF